MQIVRWSGPSAVVRVKTREDVTVAIPSGVPDNDVLDLASLILSNGEYQELRLAIEPASQPGPGRSGHDRGPSRMGMPSRTRSPFDR